MKDCAADSDPQAAEFVFQYRFPHPIALPYRRMVVSSAPVARLAHLERAWEMLLRYLLFLSLAEYRSRGQAENSVEVMLRGFPPKPSLGKWLELQRGLVQHLTAVGHEFLVPGVFEGWLRARDAPCAQFDELIARRNRVHHLDREGVATAEGATREVEGQLPMVHRLLRHCEPLARAPLVAVSECRPGSSGNHRYALHRCMGAESSFTYQSCEGAEALPANEVLLMTADLTGWLSLHPLLLFAEGAPGGQRSLYVLEGVDERRTDWWSVTSNHSLRLGPSCPEATQCASLFAREGPPSPGRRGQTRLADWAHQRLKAEDPDGEGLLIDGRYRVLGKIRAGGMGEVYLCRQEPVGSPRALKLLTQQQSCDERSRERFNRSARASMSFDHPNLVPVHDFGWHEGRPYTVMSYMPGGDLRERLLREGPLQPDHAVNLIRQVLAGVAYLHDQGLVHRDLKPANVLFSADETPKIADYGILRPLDGPALTGGNTALGTEGYMAPEQQRGDSADPRSDIYSVGALLCALVTGQDPPDLRTLPPALEPLLRRCLDPDPDRRFSGAEVLRVALEHWQDLVPNPGHSPPCRGAAYGQRFVAGMIDTTPFYVVGLLFTSSAPLHNLLSMDWIIPVMKGAFGLLLLYHTVMSSASRNTLGRMVVGIRVVDLLGKPLTWARSALRALSSNPLAVLLLLLLSLPKGFSEVPPLNQLGQILLWGFLLLSPFRVLSPVMELLDSLSGTRVIRVGPTHSHE